ncbi:uncharacterized protein LOC123777144 [Ursus americanus]|uniref:uncharacterized protein LOC123777144 n=1 Tax=Ursus americanus TaxID=9643 RepID=UPI001E6792FB|nr:uncharacterized protein LOC123777144 [Ursus americanus]
MGGEWTDVIVYCQARAALHPGQLSMSIIAPSCPGHLLHARRRKTQALPSRARLKGCAGRGQQQGARSWRGAGKAAVPEGSCGAAGEQGRWRHRGPQNARIPSSACKHPELGPRFQGSWFVTSDLGRDVEAGSSPEPLEGPHGPVCAPPVRRARAPLLRARRPSPHGPTPAGPAHVCVARDSPEMLFALDGLRVPLKPGPWVNPGACDNGTAPLLGRGRPFLWAPLGRVTRLLSEGGKQSTEQGLPGLLGRGRLIMRVET